MNSHPSTRAERMRIKRQKEIQLVDKATHSKRRLKEQLKEKDSFDDLSNARHGELYP